MTTKYDPKKDLQDSAIDAAWLTGGLAIVNFSLKALETQDRFLATPSRTMESCTAVW